MEPEKIAAVTAALAAVTAVGVAAWQGWLQRLALRHSLFERRVKVFDALMTFLSAVSRTGGNYSPEDVRLFLSNSRAAEFLFRRAVPEFLDLVVKRASELKSFNARVDNTPDNQQKIRLLTELEPVQNWLFVTAFSEAKRIFRPYLKLSEGDWNEDLLEPE